MCVEVAAMPILLFHNVFEGLVEQDWDILLSRSVVDIRANWMVTDICINSLNNTFENGIEKHYLHFINQPTTHKSRNSIVFVKPTFHVVSDFMISFRFGFWKKPFFLLDWNLVLELCTRPITDEPPNAYF